MPFKKKAPIMRGARAMCILVVLEGRKREHRLHCKSSGALLQMGICLYPAPATYYGITKNANRMMSELRLRSNWR